MGWGRPTFRMNLESATWIGVTSRDPRLPNPTLHLTDRAKSGFPRVSRTHARELVGEKGRCCRP